MNTDYELIRIWRKHDFTLHLYDTFRRDSYGKCVLAYEFKDGRAVIFSGEDFHASPLYAIDSNETIEALLSFLSLH